MRIAIVGGGISGLVAAYLLAREHEVTVFEAGRDAGGHTNTIRVDTEHETHHVDTGFIVFNDRNYPNFQRLLTRLDVRTQPSNMSFGVSDGRGDFEYTGGSANGLFAKRTHLVTPWFHRMIVDLARFNRAARELLGGDESGPSLGHWLEQQRFSRPFIERLIVPQASAVWSADPSQMWSFPARFLIEFFDNHGMLGFRDRPRWRTVTRRLCPLRRGAAAAASTGGSGSTRRSPASPAPPITCSSRPAAPSHAGSTRSCSRRTPTRRSDCSTTRPTASSELLRAIPYQPNEAVLHTDTAMLPRPPARVGELECTICRRPRKTATTVTYHMNRLQSLTADREFCVTLNRTGEIDPSQGDRDDRYAHPVFTGGRDPRPAPGATRSAAVTARISPAPTGAGAFTRTGSSPHSASRRDSE